MAAEYADTKEQHTFIPTQITFGEALERYINERSAVLSPASIRKYRSMQRNKLNELDRYRLENINQDIIQQFINNAATTRHYWKYRMHLTLEELIKNKNHFQLLSI